MKALVAVAGAVVIGMVYYDVALPVVIGAWVLAVGVLGR